MNTLFALLFLASLVVLVAGFIKPSIVKQTSRKHVGYIFGSVAVLLLAAISVTSPIADNQPQNVVATTETTAGATTTIQPNTPTPTPPQNKPRGAAVTANSNTSQTQKTTTPTATAPAFTSGTTQTSNQNTAPVSTETVSQKNAVRKAQSYLNYTAFSHDGLVAQLEYDQFSPADALYGADNSGANWDEQAAAKAKSYMEYSAFSRDGLIAQLEYDKFTQAQAEYGASAVGL